VFEIGEELVERIKFSDMLSGLGLDGAVEIGRLQNVSRIAAEWRGPARNSAEADPHLNLPHPSSESTNWRASPPC